MPLLDEMQSLDAAADAMDESDFVADMEYQSRAFMIEQALRDIGALPNPELARGEKPYDKDLKDLIDQVSME